MKFVYISVFQRFPINTRIRLYIKLKYRNRKQRVIRYKDLVRYANL